MSDTFIFAIGCIVFALLAIGLFLTYRTFSKIPEMERRLRSEENRSAEQSSHESDTM